MVTSGYGYVWIRLASASRHGAVGVEEVGEVGEKGH
jgi:hypothetical protein